MTNKHLITLVVVLILAALIAIYLKMSSAEVQGNCGKISPHMAQNLVSTKQYLVTKSEWIKTKADSLDRVHKRGEEGKSKAISIAGWHGISQANLLDFDIYVGKLKSCELGEAQVGQVIQRLQQKQDSLGNLVEAELDN